MGPASRGLWICEKEGRGRLNSRCVARQGKVRPPRAARPPSRPRKHLLRVKEKVQGEGRETVSRFFEYGVNDAIQTSSSSGGWVGG